ncbi:G-type lectin S-receptor-like serine/threonine-protein kinase At1g34300 [Phragmites australis]|uniref:G-type lectin S-receptor-like serine/threonine-protein kinase At1g34300 n=1 Tax=Phragmites australis TaxID=29695 RepID=UPI002D78F256|nr:G-type lectin S-receptor-like serine/threonine-protein kinase At1g34300 [Phragmites australis]XP_062200391.1 G-type lectin S-receptor-like serine/threonine-protein kinase At1g34300 [Phragmites australis]
MIPVASLPLLALLLIPHLAAAQAQQQQQMPSFSANDKPWSPTERNRTLVSRNRDFAAGFVPSPSPSTPGNYRFAVWVVTSNSTTNNNAIVWYAHNKTNYNASEADGASALAVDAAGVLSWTTAGNKTIWSPVANPSTNTAVLQLNDTGSLVYGPVGSPLWSSFAEPTDTLMAGQAIPGGGNGTTLQSANGRYRLTSSTTLQFGHLMYANMSSAPTQSLVNLTADGTLVLSGGKLIASDQGSTKRLRRLKLDDDGNLRLYSLRSRTRQWRVVWQLVQELCTIRGTCADGRICVPVGADGISCVCPPGYRNTTQNGPCEPKKNYSRKGDDDKFFRMDFVSFSGGAPTAASDPGPLMTKLTPKNLAKCESICRGNASCVAFGYKFGGDRTCLQYTRLADGYWSPATEASTFLLVASSDNDRNPFTGMTDMIETVCPVRLALPVPPKQRATTIRNVAIITALFAVELLAGVLSFWAFLRKYSQYREMARTLGLEYLPAGGPRRFSYAELKAATKDFSGVVGRGGYGTVYRGELPDRRAVAVKQLNSVGGGEAEFWAEVTIIARMHHLNLVRMWGFCADREQRMLVYEYVPNGSLDKYLFANPNAGAGGDGGEPAAEAPPADPLLDLHTRYRIALGVARAIAYLHEECLEWVLHCDIKPENILLEDDFCPKVSDFGLSKLTSKRDKVTMSRIRGTRGYMAPEWVIHREPITAKADVYSFGMVLLEIVSGRRNYGFRQESVGSEDWYFPKWAYEKVYVEQRIDDIIDPRIAASYDDAVSVATVERMVKTAMWCLQDRAEMRPSMGKVAKMLEGSVEITEPVKPTIFCVQDE